MIDSAVSGCSGAIAQRISNACAGQMLRRSCRVRRPATPQRHPKSTLQSLRSAKWGFRKQSLCRSNCLRVARFRATGPQQQPPLLNQQPLLSQGSLWALHIYGSADHSSGRSRHSVCNRLSLFRSSLHHLPVSSQSRLSRSLSGGREALSLELGGLLCNFTLRELCHFASGSASLSASQPRHERYPALCGLTRNR